MAILIFGKIGRVASKNVIVELLKLKCLPGLYMILLSRTCRTILMPDKYEARSRYYL